MNCYRGLGIIGGMGPQSTLLLYRYIVEAMQHQRNAWKDEDYPEIVIHNLPIEDITKSIENADIIRMRLKRCMKLFSQCGLKLIAFPCNTLDYFTGFLRSISQLEIISLVEETCNRIRRNQMGRILLVSTKTTYEQRLYHRRLPDVIIDRIPNPNELYSIIDNVLKGHIDNECLYRIIDAHSDGYDGIVIGCTELSILAEQCENRKIVDSLRVLTESIIRKM